MPGGRPRYVTHREVAGQLAACAIRLSPGITPEGLLEVVREFMLQWKPVSTVAVERGPGWSKWWSPGELEVSIRPVLSGIAQVQSWSKPDFEFSLLTHSVAQAAWDLAAVSD